MIYAHAGVGGLRCGLCGGLSRPGNSSHPRMGVVSVVLFAFTFVY